MSEADSRFCPRCGASLSAASSVSSLDPLIGRRLGGGYVLNELIGVGGMGRVYRAEQDALQRTVAVKVIHPHLLDDERTVARFYREARASSRLNHPNSVGIIDFGRTEDGVLYLVMEHLVGSDLADILAHEGMMPVSRVCNIVEQVLEALIEAHALGVVHRDLKPENILITPLRSGGDLVKVVDFGLATITDKGGPTERITLAGNVCGTAEYMSPEQIRGAPVDARADIYAMGIVLFELLTGSPPFTSDSAPAKIVFRHLREQVVDPREVAPLRGIPPELAEITLRALRKKPDDRYGSASAMLAAMHTVTPQLGVPTVKCKHCGTRSPSRTRFCGGCGERMPRPTTLDAPPPQSAPRLTAYPKVAGEELLIGREHEIERLERALQQAGDSSQWIHVAGESGVGKTRLLTEVGRLAADAGAVVVGAKPHPSRTPVPYWPIRALITRLLGLDDGQLPEEVDRVADEGDALVVAGLHELVEPTGLAGFENRSRIGAVASAVSDALQRALPRSRGGRVVVLLDDLHECDGLSKRVLARLRLDRPGVLLVTSSRGAREPSELADMLTLEGLPPEDVTVHWPELPLHVVSAVGSGARLLPLYVQQLRALSSASHDYPVPPRVADAIGQRLQRLEREPTRLLQAAAVLGDRCPREWLEQVVEGHSGSALGGLEAEGLVRFTDEEVELTHPFVRDLVLGSTPSEARHELHVRALRVAVEHGAPLEVRAEHAFGSGESFGAMVVLEQMGDVALKRGDPDAAVLAFRRALQVARRELLETGDLLLEQAIVTFSRKLGIALERCGDASGAEGVLREALDLTPPDSVSRGRILHALGSITIGRGRMRQGERFLRAALDIATSRGESDLEGEIYQALGRARRSVSDLPAAVEHLRRACDLYGRQARSSQRRLLTLVELGQALVEAGDEEEAEELVREAHRLADESRSPAGAALALATMAHAQTLSGNAGQAEVLYRSAAKLAAEAGDADWHHEWDRLSRAS